MKNSVSACLHPRLILLFYAAMGTAFSAWAAEPVYVVTDLGTLTGYNESGAIAINIKGQVVGYSLSDLGTRATLFSTTGSTNTDLGGLSTKCCSVASDINDLGQVVGSAIVADKWDGYDVYHATLFSSTGATNVDLGTLGGMDSYAQGISNNGQIVGYSRTADGNYHATIFNSMLGANMDLGTLGGEISIAYGVNDHGQVVGSAQVADGSFRPTLFDATGQSSISMVDIGNNWAIHARGINNSGQAVGYTIAANGSKHATLFSTTGGANTDLGTLENKSASMLSINNSGQAVGYISDPYDDYEANTAIIWESGVMKTLDSLIDPRSGWHLLQARDINDVGQVVGLGINATGQSHAFLLTPMSSNPANISPVAHAGADIAVKKSSSVTLNGSKSIDPDGWFSSASYAWTAPGMPTLTGINPKQAFTKTGTYTYTLTVTDIKGATSTDQVVVKVFDANYSQVYLRGTHNDWSKAPSAKMTLVGNNTWQADAVFTKATNEAFKFDINGDWKLNFGNNNADNIADQNGKNIKITKGAGTYRIVFNDKTKVYSVTKK